MGGSQSSQSGEEKEREIETLRERIRQLEEEMAEIRRDREEKEREIERQRERITQLEEELAEIKNRRQRGRKEKAREIERLRERIRQLVVTEEIQRPRRRSEDLSPVFFHADFGSLVQSILIPPPLPKHDESDDSDDSAKSDKSKEEVLSF